MLSLPLSAGQNRRGERVLRVGQTSPGDNLINIMLVIVIAAAVGFVGTDVTEELDENAEVGLEGDDFTVTNESFTVNFSTTTADNFNYTVNKEGDAASFDDDEVVRNATDATVTEGTDYEWFTSNGTLRIFNTSAWTTGDGGNITYNGTDRSTDFGDAKNNLSSGYADAMSLTDIVFLVLMFSVILGALLVFRVRF